MTVLQEHGISPETPVRPQVWTDKCSLPFATFGTMICMTKISSLVPEWPADLPGDFLSSGRHYRVHGTVANLLPGQASSEPLRLRSGRRKEFESTLETLQAPGIA